MKTRIWKTLILGAGFTAATSMAALAQDTTVTTVRNGPETATEPMNEPAAAPASAQTFVLDAIWGSDKEVALGKLAQQKSQNPDVRAFAARMVADHSRAADKLTTIADNEHLYYPSENSFSFVTQPGYFTTTTTTTGARNNSDLDNVKGLPAKAMTQPSWASRTNADIMTINSIGGLSGPDFDRAYVNEMVKDHQKDVREFESASANLDDQQLKQCAAQLLPTIQDHLRLAQDLQAKLGGPAAPSGTIRTRSSSGY